MKLSDLTCCVVDKGMYLHVAQSLSEQYSKVFYWSPWEEAFSHLDRGIIGDGYGDKLVRVPNFWDVKDQCDLFVFTDVGFSGEQHELMRQGFPVWGHRGADVLETHRGMFLKTLEQLGLPVAPHEVVRGLESLKEHLRDKTDKYIKISKWRGDWDTFHWRSWEEDEFFLDCESYHLGPSKELITFYVFDKINTDIEDGSDSYCINGQWPSRLIHGMERKDKAYLCALQDASKLHSDILAINEKFGPVLEEFRMCGPWSTEARMTEEATFFIDPTIRFGAPPSQVQFDLIGNWGEIIWNGANGVCVEPEEAEEGNIIGAQVRIMGNRDEEEWATLKLPDKVKPFVKASFACQINGLIRVAPNIVPDFLGWLTATGKSIEQVIETLKERKEMLPDGMDCDLSPIANLLAEAKEAELKGVKMSNQEIPEPAEALDV